MTADPAIALTEEVGYQGSTYLIEWIDADWMPPLAESTQAYGLCFTAEGQIVLVQMEPDTWTLPGGGIERGETFEQALAREVVEEACARVLATEYIGCQRVTQLTGVSSWDGQRRPIGVAHYQTRYWARVALDTWDPKHETTARKLVVPDDFLTELWWGRAPTARIILENGLAAESRARP